MPYKDSEKAKENGKNIILNIKKIKVIKSKQIQNEISIISVRPVLSNLNYVNYRLPILH